MVRMSIINMQLAIKIKNINQEIMLICVFSFLVGVKSLLLLMRFLNSMGDSKKMETPITPKSKYGMISEYDGFDFLVVIIITPVKPIIAIMAPISLLSVNGKCLMSDIICFLIVPIFILPYNVGVQWRPPYGRLLRHPVRLFLFRTVTISTQRRPKRDRLNPESR